MGNTVSREKRGGEILQLLNYTALQPVITLAPSVAMPTRFEISKPLSDKILTTSSLMLFEFAEASCLIPMKEVLASNLPKDS